MGSEPDGRSLRDFRDERSDVVGTEFAGTSPSSGGNGAPIVPFAKPVSPQNPHVDLHNAHRGYALVSVTSERWTATFRRVPIVEEPGGPVETLTTFVVEDGRAGAERG